MGPAILLCPSYSAAAQLWGQTLPSSMKLKQKEGSITMSHRCPPTSAGDFSPVRPAFFLLPSSFSDKYRRYFSWRSVSTAAAASEVSVEEAVAMSDAEQSASGESSTTSDVAPTAEKAPPRKTFNRSNSNARKAAAVVSPAELVPGAQFAGKVVAIQTFGAFVDLGAFTNGLVHISRLSKSYVKKVEDVVQVGQDVKVQILEVDFEANRISLMLVEEDKEEASQEEFDKAGETQGQRAAQQPTRAPRRDAAKRPPAQKKPATTLKKNETVTGIVKNMIKSGVFISLPDGTDGYLPVAEVIFKAPNITSLEAQFQVGEEVSVRVLKIERGRVNLTMRREVNFDKLNEDVNKGVIGMATNPFELAFRRNEVIASYLAERDKQKAQTEVVDEMEEASVSDEEVKDDVENGVQAEVVDEVKEEAPASVEEAKDDVDDGKNVEDRIQTEVVDHVKEETPAAFEQVKDDDEAVEDPVKSEVVDEPKGEEVRASVEESIVDDEVAEDRVQTGVVNELKEEEASTPVEEVKQDDTAVKDKEHIQQQNFD